MSIIKSPKRPTSVITGSSDNDIEVKHAKSVALVSATLFDERTHVYEMRCIKEELTAP